ncbi:hypothetical protein ES705_29039 [subsurface metagenome]
MLSVDSKGDYKLPGKLKIDHHTLADWDFQHGALYRSLAADYYISEPTSLKYSGAPSSWATTILCRIPATLNLPQGEMRAWFRSNYKILTPAVFRNQAALGTANYDNCYYVRIGAVDVSLVSYVGGFPSVRDSFAYTGYMNEWRHHRVFWYNGKTPAEQPSICVDLYDDVGGEWVKQGTTLYDTLNRWKDSAINRCGHLPLLYSGRLRWFDDTEIWGPV